MRATRVLLVIAGVAAAASAGAWRADAVRDARKGAAVQASKVRAWARSEAAAGMSVLPKRVPEADRRELRTLADLPGFRAFAMRCSSCHHLPDPAAYSGREWAGKISEMRDHIQRAGVLPPAPGELDSVRAFLDAASDSLRRR